MYSPSEIDFSSNEQKIQNLLDLAFSYQNIIRYKDDCSVQYFLKKNGRDISWYKMQLDNIYCEIQAIREILKN